MVEQSIGDCAPVVIVAWKLRRQHALLVEDSGNAMAAGSSPHNEPITMGIAKINTTAPVYIGCRSCA
jgi:hypothetical protein